MRQTVIVIGAGASVDFGLPVGNQLARTIADKVDFRWSAGSLVSGDEALLNAVRAAWPSEVGKFIAAGAKITEGIGLHRSIDDFLHNHADDPAVVTLGKAAIAASILEAEFFSRTAEHLTNYQLGGKPNVHALKDSWLYKMVPYLVTGVQRSNVMSLFSDISFINFNYDRCLETVLYSCLQAAYGIEAADAAAVMATLPIVHPYGVVGRLPWQAGDEPAVPFGSPANAAPLIALGEQIRTFTEQTHDPQQMALVQTLLQNANQIVFLGFGFHQQNMDLLNLSTSHGSKAVFGTAFGASMADSAVFKARIAGAHLSSGRAIDLSINMIDCAKFIDQSGLTLF